MTSQPSALPNTKMDDVLPQYKSEVWGLPAILIFGLAMTAISWDKWGDLLVDFGSQLYLPWQLTEGKVLYRDLEYLFGPFSVHLHALLFKLFGPGIPVLVWFNLGLVAALTLLIYLLFQYFSDALTATLASLAFLGMFAFGQYMGGGNFNFVCAYVYELAHGVFLSFLVLWIFTRALENHTRGKLILTGLLTGVVYLTKPEAFLALAAALTLGFYFLDKKQTPPRYPLLLLTGAFLIAPVSAVIYFSLKVPVSEAVHYVLLPWFHILGSPIKGLPMYLWLLGTDFIGQNIWNMFLYFLLIVGFCLGLMALDRWAGRFLKKPYPVGWGLSLVLIFSVGFWYTRFPLFDLPRSLPLIVLGGSLFLFWENLKSPQTVSNRTLGLLVFSIFSLVLMFKMILHVQITHYGFALALPATLMLIHFLTHEIPKRLARKLKPQNIYRPVAVTAVAVFIGLHVQFEYKIYSLKGQPVGTGADTLLDYHAFLNPRGPMFNDTIKLIRQEVPEGSHFAAFPVSIMLNYMTRRESSLKYVYLDPGAFMFFGDYRIYGDLVKARPSHIVLIEQKFPQHGRTHFGKDFGRHIFRWIHENYFIIRQYGAEPFTSEDFGIQIFKRKPPPGK